MLKRSGVIVIHSLTVIAGRYEACLMLMSISAAPCSQNMVYNSPEALTVRDRMISWWLVELLISWAIKSARPEVPANVRRMPALVVFLLVERMPYLLLRRAYCWTLLPQALFSRMNILGGVDL